MSEAFGSVITEHAAWRIAKHHRSRVFNLPEGGQWLVTIEKATVSYRPLTLGVGRPRLDVFSLPGTEIREIPELVCALRGLGSVARFRTCSLWDAIGTAIIRQV